MGHLRIKRWPWVAVGGPVAWWPVGQPPVPRQFSSGDRKVLMGISKRGNQHLRSLLVHGARAVVRTAPKKIDVNNQTVNPREDSRDLNHPMREVARKNTSIV